MGGLYENARAACRGAGEVTIVGQTLLGLADIWLST